jgi:hypothetical protein
LRGVEIARLADMGPSVAPFSYLEEKGGHLAFSMNFPTLESQQFVFLNVKCFGDKFIVPMDGTQPTSSSAF